MTRYPTKNRKQPSRPAPPGLRGPIAALLGELIIDGANEDEAQRRLSLACADRAEFDAAIQRSKNYRGVSEVPL
jgi:hypothetical protein